jgi:hypothetical protein
LNNNRDARATKNTGAKAALLLDLNWFCEPKNAIASFARG